MQRNLWRIFRKPFNLNLSSLRYFYTGETKTELAYKTKACTLFRATQYLLSHITSIFSMVKCNTYDKYTLENWKQQKRNLSGSRKLLRRRWNWHFSGHYEGFSLSLSLSLVPSGREKVTWLNCQQWTPNRGIGFYISPRHWIESGRKPSFINFYWRNSRGIDSIFMNDYFTWNFTVN